MYAVTAEILDATVHGFGIASVRVVLDGWHGLETMWVRVIGEQGPGEAEPTWEAAAWIESGEAECYVSHEAPTIAQAVKVVLYSRFGPEVDADGIALAARREIWGALNA